MPLPERVVKVKLKMFNSRYFDPTDQPNAMMINKGNFLGWLVAQALMLLPERVVKVLPLQLLRVSHWAEADADKQN